MGLFDEIKATAKKAEKAAAEHPDQVNSALNKVAGLVDKQTGGGHHKQILEAEEKAEGLIAKDANKP